MITRQSDGMSGVAGDFEDSDSDAGSDSYVDLEELLPMNELSFSQVSWLPSCRPLLHEQAVSTIASRITPCKPLC